MKLRKRTDRVPYEEEQEECRPFFGAPYDTSQRIEPFLPMSKSDLSCYLLAAIITLVSIGCGCLLQGYYEANDADLTPALERVVE